MILELKFHDKTLKSFDLQDKSYSIGRSDKEMKFEPDIDIELFDTDAMSSRNHAILVKNGDSVTVEDLGSLNGTFIVSKKLTDRLRMQVGRKYSLEAGDCFVIGKLIFQLKD